MEPGHPRVAANLGGGAMSGAPRDLYASRDFIVINLGMVDLVGWEATAVFQRIAYRAERDGYWQATHADIQAETRLSEHRVKAALVLLRERGWLTSERASRFDPTQVWTPLWDHQHVTENHTVTVTENHTVTPITQTGKTTDTPIPPSVDAVLVDLPTESDPFDQWWSLYPRKIGKAAARKAYERVTRTVPTSVLHEALVVQRGALATENARGFCPHPATWLNGGRWEDDVAAISQDRVTATRQNYFIGQVQSAVVGGTLSLDQLMPTRPALNGRTHHDDA